MHRRCHKIYLIPSALTTKPLSLTCCTERASVTIEPDYLEVSLGDTVEFRCHVTPSGAGRVTWSRDRGDLPINARIDDEAGLLSFQATSEDQAGRYSCLLLDDRSQTIDTASAQLVIHLGFSVFLLHSIVLYYHSGLGYR